MISLAPPRNPQSRSARDRRWTIIIARPGQAEYIELFGTAAHDPVGAKQAANRRLERDLTWAPRGHGFIVVSSTTIPDSSGAQS